MAEQSESMDWWDRLSYAASTWGRRFAEEAGWYDPWEEFGKFDDDTLSVSQKFGRGFAGFAQGISAIPETLMAGAGEINKGIGVVQGVLANQLLPGAFGVGPTGTKVGDPAYRRDYIGDYFTGGISPEKREQYRRAGMPEDMLRSRYEPASASDVVIWSADHIRNVRGTGALFNPLSGGWIYGAGALFNPEEGRQRNGSFLPAAYDIWAPDAGTQLWERSGLTHQLIASQIVVESAVDPLNFLAGPIAAMIRGATRPTLVMGKGGRALDSVAAADALSMIGNTATDMNAWQRASQWATGRGTWDQQRMLTNMARNPMVYGALQDFANTTDVTVIRRMLSSQGVAAGEGADALASVIAKLDTAEDVGSLMYAAAYRDEAAFARVMAKLEHGVNDLAVANTLRTMTGTGRNVLESTFFEFGNGTLPVGHLLRVEGAKFVDDAIKRYDAAAGVLPDNPLSLQKQWDALAEAAKKQELDELHAYQASMRAAENLLEVSRSGEQIVTSLPQRGARGRARQVAAAQAGRSPNRVVAFAEQLRTSRVPAILVNGRSLRTSGTVYLMAKPGLTFALHGIDAVERFQGVIKYVDGIIGSAVADAPSGRFADLPEVRDLLDSFVQAGAQSRSPQQARAAFVDQLQTLAIQKIAEARGIDPDAARVLADAGIERARDSAKALNSLDEGYVSTLMEDGRPLFLKSHPTTLRQTANHVPIMDLKMLDDALKAKGTQNALTVNGRPLSTAVAKVRAQGLLEEATGKVRTEMDPSKVLRQVGRGGVASATHSVVDVLDEVHTLFKAGVLFRLGYGFRNIAEAHLAVSASGVGWLGVLKHADLLGQLSNFLVNRKNGPLRMRDRWKSLRGLIDEPDSIEFASNSVAKARDHAGDRVFYLINAATDPENVQALATRAANGDDEAIDALRTLMQWRARMTHELGDDMVASGLITDPSVADEVLSSATYYHTDVAGTFDEAAPLTRPISVVSNPVVARTAVNSQWAPGPAWNPSPTWTPGTLSGTTQFPRGALTPAQQKVLAGLDQVKWTLRGDGSVKAASGTGLDDLMAALDREALDAADRARILRDAAQGQRLTAKAAAAAERAAKEQVVEDAAKAGRSWMADEPNRGVFRGAGTAITKAEDGTYSVYQDLPSNQAEVLLGEGYPTLLDAKVAVLNGEVRTGGVQPLRRPMDDPDYAKEYRKGRAASQRWGRSPGTGESPLSRADQMGRPDAWYHGYEDHAAGRGVGEGPMEEVSVHRYSPPPAAPKPDGPTLAQRAVEADQRAKTLARARDSLNERAQWMAREKELERLAKTHRVQFQRAPGAPWVDWKPGATKYRPKFNPQFRVIPGTSANPRTVAIDAWSPMIDLTDSRVVDAVIKNYPDFPLKTLGEARAGDRAAQEKLMDVFAKEGFYRVKFPEPSGAWNGEHVMLHPDAVGAKAFSRHVQDMFDKVTDPANATPRNRSLLMDSLSRSERAKMNRGDMPEGGLEMPAPLTGSDFYVDQKRVLANGGFEAVMEESLGTLRKLNEELATLDMAHIATRKRQEKIAKRHGARAKTWKFASKHAYNGRFLIEVDDLLHGPDGGAYSDVTAGQISQHLVYAQAAHHGDLMNDMSRAMMNPEEIHPGSARFWEGLANYLGRHGRDTPGAVTPMGLQTRDIDPVLLRALQRGDREQQINDTVEWALSTREGRDWVGSMDLQVVDTVDEALKRADLAAKKRLRELQVPRVTRKMRRDVAVADWGQKVKGGVTITKVELADVIRAQFNFVDTHLPTDRVRDLFRTGNATADTLKAAWQAEPWELYPFNGLLSPTHAEFRKAMKQKRENQYAISKASNALIRGLSKGLESIGTKPETMLARHPVFQQIGYSDLRQRLAFAEATQDGPLSLDQILSLRSASQRFAVKKMEETLYTMKTRSSVDEFMRFIMPFFPAWKNTVHRWGRFSVENPAGVARIGRLYQTTIEQLPYYDYATGEQISLDEAESKRDAFTLMPGIGAMPFVGRLLPEPLREAMRRTKVNLGTWDVVFQGEIMNPGFGPLVAVGAQEFMDRHQKLYDTGIGRSVIKEWLLPYGPQQTGNKGLDALYAWLPSAAKPLANHFLDTQAQMSLYNKIGMTYVVNGHDMNPDGTYKTKEQISSEIDTAVATYNMVRVFSYLVSPVATTPVGDNEYYAAQFRSLRETAASEQEAQDLFLERFGPLPFLYTAPTSYNLTGGQSTSAVVENQRSQTELQAEILSTWDNPKALGFFENLDATGTLMPYDPESYNPYARNWQLRNSPEGSTENWRGGKEFDEYLADAKVNLGWRYYDEGMDRVDVAMRSQGYVTGSPEWMKERAARARQVGAYVEGLVPEWASSRSVVDTDKTERNADLFWWALNESQWGKANRNLGIAQDMRAYLQAREEARREIASRNASDSNWPNTLSAEKNADIAARLLYLRERLSESPTFKQWVDQFFRTDEVAYAEERFPGQSRVEAVVR